MFYWTIGVIAAACIVAIVVDWFRPDCIESMRAIALAILLMTGFVLLFGHALIQSSKASVRELNRTYGVEYDWQEYFWAGEVIRESVLQRQIKLIEEAQ